MICCWPFLTRLDLLTPSWAGWLAQPAGRWLLSERADDASAGGQPSGSRWMSHDTRCKRRRWSRSTGQSEAPAGRHADQPAAPSWIEGDELSEGGCAGSHRATLLRIGRREASRKNQILLLKGFNYKKNPGSLLGQKAMTVNEVTLRTKALKQRQRQKKKMVLQRKPRPAADPCHKNPRAPSSQYTKLINFVLF